MTDYSALLVALVRGGVRFIVIGGAAALAHGSARLTQDLDVVYARERENIERLVRTLAPMHPYLRGAPEGLPFVFDAPTILAGLNFTLTTTAGDFDALGEVVGGGRYEDLAPSAVEMRGFGVAFLCVSLEKLIQLKRAAGRPKDLDAIAELEALKEEKSR